VSAFALVSRKSISLHHGEPPPDQAMSRCVRGMSWRWEGVDFRVLHPVTADGRRDNPASCVLRIEAAGRVVLLTGDIDASVETLLLRSGSAELRADLVQVPHHGSRSSSGAGFVAAVSPRWALVSSGFRNRFGHPHPDVVARWRSEGAQILDTAVDGAILLQVDDTGQLHAPVRWRERERRFWHREAGRLAQTD
jgi:competence protein ComEC